MKNILDKITKTSIYLLVFILPLFFLPWTANVLDFNKQALLIFLVFISLFSWLLKSLIEGKISLNLNLFNIPVLVFLVISGIGTFFSFYRYGSFWGWPLDITASFLTTLGFFLLYLLIINNFKKIEIFSLLLLLALSSFLVALLGGLQLFGKFIFPFDFSKVTSFNTVGTVNSLGIFLAVLLPLFLILFFITKRVMKFLFLISVIISLVLLLIINFWVAWIVVLVGMMIILVFGIARREEFKAAWLAIPMVFLVLSLFFGVFKIGIPGLPPTPLEISPSQRASIDIAKEVLKEKPILGTGPGTFVYDYSKFKPESINQTAFWAVRFSSSASDILDRMATNGILGFLTYFSVLAIFFGLAMKTLVKREEKKEEEIEVKGVSKEGRIYDWLFGLSVFSGWLSIVAGLFLYPSNLSLGFIFWILTACFIVLTESRVKTWKLEPSSLKTISISFLFIIILIFGIGLFFLTGQRYIAEVRYLQGITAWQEGKNDQALTYLLSAISHSGGSQDNYWRDLSQIYLLRIEEEIQKGLTPEETAKVVSPLISNSVNSTKAATDIAPKNVANWSVRGFVYRQMVNVLDGAGEWAIKSYEEALKLEPTNPYILTELGQIYSNKDEKDKAREQFQKALSLKSDYAPARFQIALIYVGENKISEAISEMEDAKKQSPTDVGVAFQLGLLYYNDGKLSQAKAEFERAVSLNEDYSNARYFLGLIYDKEGNKTKVIEQFEKIEKLNPENEEVKKILVNLRANKPALEGITPAQPPIEEKPEEVLKK
jgi:tetratricopeptide (TPR) repeat protein